MLIIVPIGHDCKTEDDVKAAWEAGKEFLVRTIGPYDGARLSCRDLDFIKSKRFTSIKIRFNNRENFTVLEL